MIFEKNNIKLAVFLFLFILSACGGSDKKEKEASAKPETNTASVPRFNADSAYAFVKKQVDFGPRVPNTEAHMQAADYFINQFKTYGATVSVQEFDATTFDNQTVHLKNIMAAFKPESKKRILLTAHWDSRPFADKDTVDQYKPIDAANDGASGVAVLLEIARLLKVNEMPEVGVDILLFDGEDWGETMDAGNVELPEGLESWWCLGSQYWAKHKGNYSAYYGVLLDMVGGQGSQFWVEDYSNYFASQIVRKVWNTGRSLGYSNYFVNRQGGAVTDDHYFVNKVAKIPMVDIIAHDPVDNSFGAFHHTHQDNMDIISKETLDAVGNTLMHVIYYEK